MFCETSKTQRDKLRREETELIVTKLDKNIPRES